MMHRLKRGDTFCVLPWIHSFQNLDNKHYFCCHSNLSISDPTSNETESLRQKIWDGEKINHCNGCYNIENNNAISARQRESIRWLKNKEVASIFAGTASPSYKPIFFDIRLDNKCNAACITCNPYSSSLWAKELKINANETNYKLDLDTLVHAKKLYFAGGEPLIIQEYLELIENLSKLNPEIELVINTNLSNIPDETISHLKTISKTTIVASIDAYGPVHEYHRYPLKWDKFLRNLEKAKEAKLNIMFNTVASAVSVFGFGKLLLLEPFTNQWGVSILDNPNALKLNNIPKHLKDVAISEVDNLRNTKTYNTDIMFKKQIDLIISMINEDGDPFLLSNFIKDIDTRRNLSHAEFIGVNLIEN